MAKSSKKQTTNRIELLPSQKEKEIAKLVAKFHSGPLPSAEDFAEYERIHHGAAKKIIGMASTALRAEIGNKYIESITFLISMLLGKLFVYFLTAISVYLVMQGKEVAAFIAAIGPVAIAINSALDGKTSQNKNSK